MSIKSRKILNCIAIAGMVFTMSFGNVTTGKVLANEDLPQINSIINNQTEGENLIKQNIQSTTGQAIQLSFDNLVNEEVFGTNVIEVTGEVSELPDSFKINGEEVNIGLENNPLAFKHLIELESGLNNINVEIIDQKGELIEDEFIVYCDDTAPVITLTNLTVDGDNTIIELDENVNNFIIEGTVEDDLFGYNLFINGKNILTVENDEIGQDTKRSFIYEVPIVEDITVINIEAKDLYIQNTTSQAVTLMITENNTDNPFEIENLTGEKTFHNGDQAKIDIKAVNITEASEFITLLVGIFDEDNVMVNITAASQTVAPNGEVILTGILNIPEEGNYKLRALVWDSFEFMNSLTDVIEYNIEP